MALALHNQLSTLTWKCNAFSRSRIAPSEDRPNASEMLHDFLSHNSCDAAEEHKEPEYLALNTRGQIPVLVDGDIAICESLAALLYLDEAYPEHPLLPSGKAERALVSPGTGARQVLTVSVPQRLQGFRAYVDLRCHPCPQVYQRAVESSKHTGQSIASDPPEGQPCFGPPVSIPPYT